MKITIKELKEIIKDVIIENKMLKENELSSTWQGAAQSVLHDNTKGKVSINSEVISALKKLAKDGDDEESINTVKQNKWTYKDKSGDYYKLVKSNNVVRALNRSNI
jgi:hypothetical protein